MLTAFVHCESHYFYKICEAYFEANGYSMALFPPADIVIIDLDSTDSCPEVCGAKLTVLMSARVMYYLRNKSKFLPHDMFWEKPIDAWYQLETMERYLDDTLSLEQNVL